jgi:fibronectin-binding autotransporter adhesin
MKTLLSLTIVILAAFTMHASTHTWTGVTGDGRWSTAGNWSGGAPAAGEAGNVILVFPAAGTKNTTNDIANLTIDQIQISGDNYRIVGLGAGTNVTLRSGTLLSSTFFITGAGAMLTNFSFTIATNLVANASISVSPGDTATFRCRFTGSGGLIKRANGTLVFDGNAANTYAGRTEVQGGTVQLSQNGNAIPGDLVIGLPAITNLAAVELLFQNQVADNADILVNYNGTFAPGVFSDAIGSITLSNADLVAGTGLALNGPFTSIGTNTVTGTLLLGGADRTFDVTGHLAANVFIGNTSGVAGIIKEGPGAMEVLRTNSYNGTTVVSAGTLRVAHAGGLGNSGTSVYVSNGATLEIAAGLNLPTHALVPFGNGVAGAGALVLRSNAIWNGHIQLPQNATISAPDTNSLAKVAAQIVGAGGLKKIGDGILQLTGAAANTFLGGVSICEGVLELNKPAAVSAFNGSLVIGGSNTVHSARLTCMAISQIPSTTQVTVDAKGTFDLNGFSQVIGPLTLRRGWVETGPGTLTLNGNVLVLEDPLAPGYPSSIYGTVALNGNPRVFNLSGEGHLGLQGNVIDGLMISSLHKTGSGTFQIYTGNNTYSGETRALQGRLHFYNNRPGSAAAGTFVESGAELELTWVNVTNESLTINGDGGGGYGKGAVHYNNTVLWNGPVTVASDAVILGETGFGSGSARFELAGQLSGPGTLRLREIHDFIPSSTVVLTGAVDNTISGGIILEAGDLELSKVNGGVAIPSALSIGPTNVGHTATVRLMANNQIENDVAVSVQGNGLLDLNGFNDAIGSLNMQAGAVNTGVGTLTLLGDVSATHLPPLFDSAITGRLSLGGATRIFAVNLNHLLTLDAEVSDGGPAAGITKLGGGRLILTASNSFTGPFVAVAGYARITHPNALGSTLGGTVVSNDAALEIRGSFRVAGETLTLTGQGPNGTGALQPQVNGTNVWAGNIQLKAESDNFFARISSRDLNYETNSTFIIEGRITGDAALDINALGTVILAGWGTNSYTGGTFISRGDIYLSKTNGPAIAGDLHLGGYYDLSPRVILTRNEQIADSVVIDLESDGLLNLAGFTETIGSLYGSGKLDTGAGTLRVGLPDSSSSSTFSGSITGSGSGTNFIKRFASSLTLSGNNTYTGSTHVHGGLLVINGSNVNTTVFMTNNASLAGIGTLGGLIVNSGTVSPGTTTNGSSYGQLTALGNVTFKAGAKLRVELAGIDAGVNYDQFVAAGQFNLAGGVLETVLASGATTTNDQFVIVKTLYANPPAGTFTGLPEAQIFFPLAARAFQITYAGGDGSDIVLAQLTAPQPATLNGIVKLGDGTIQVGGTGSPGLTYAVYANADLNTTNWANIGNLTADGNGALDFIDNDAPNFPMRFYRFEFP